MPFEVRLVELRYADAHCHVNPVNGLGAERVAAKFRKVGGWFIALVALSPSHYGFKPFAVEGYEQVAALLAREVEAVRRAGLEAAGFLGIHPAEVDRMVAQMGVEEAYRRGIELVEAVARLCLRYGFTGLGEVGRPHYQCRAESVTICNLILDRALELARDYGLLAHLHLEQAGEATARDVSQRLKSALQRRMVAVHHARGDTLKGCLKEGLWVTVPARRDDLKLAFKQPPHYMVESDFLDDPKRPGAVVEPFRIPEEIAGAAGEVEVNEEYLWRICVDNVVEFYGVKPP